MTDTDNDIVDELLRNAFEIHHLGLRERRTENRLSPTDGLSTDNLLDVMRHRELLELLYENPLDRRDIEAALDVSRATSHRFTRWLEANDFAVRVDGVYHLTGEGDVVAETVAQFERKIRTARRLSPLLDVICEDHRDFVVEPFENATVTVATPTDPYAPVARFLDLLDDCERFRGFNTTHMIPPGISADSDPFGDSEVELIYLPDVVDSLRGGADARFERVDDHLTLLTREALPYGLALFDDRVGIGGYDDETGAMRVFVDTDTPMAMAWGERVYETFKRDSRALPAQS